MIASEPEPARRHPLAAPVECMLDDANWTTRVRPGTRSWTGPLTGSILVTGATGFVAPFVIDALCRVTDHPVICLTRAQSDSHARRRCRARFSELTLGRLNDAPNLRYVAGDLSQPGFGLEPGVLRSLSAEVSDVVHFGSVVQWFSRYGSVRACDVLGTQQLIAFAGSVRLKRLHIGGSLASRAVTARTNVGTIYEDDTLAGPPPLLGGYCQSKWVVEQLASAARDAGIPVNLFRLGDIKGVAATGAGNGEDFGYSLMSWCMANAVAPILPYRVNYLPVDEVAETIVEIATAVQDQGATFQFSNPEDAAWPQLLQMMDDVAPVALPEFIRRLNADRHSETARRLRPTFRKIHPGGGAAPVSFLDIGLTLYTQKHDTQNTAAALPHRKQGVETRLLSDGLLQRYVAYAASLEETRS